MNWTICEEKKEWTLHLSINLDGLIGLSNSQFAIAIQVYYHIKTWPCWSVEIKGSKIRR